MTAVVTLFAPNGFWISVLLRRFRTRKGHLLSGSPRIAECLIRSAYLPPSPRITEHKERLPRAFTGLLGPDLFPTLLGGAAPALARVFGKHLGEGCAQVSLGSADAPEDLAAVHILAPMAGHHLARR